MRQHTLIGERILGVRPAAGPGRAAGPLQPRALGRRRLPGRLAGEEIPLGARIIAVCDAYEAMTEARPYRAALSVAKRLTSCATTPAPSSTRSSSGCSAELVAEGVVEPVADPS